jgi:hypothetical protein
VEELKVQTTETLLDARVILVGHEVETGEVGLADRLTVPEKPLMLERVTVMGADVPATKEAVVWLAETAKSEMVRCTSTKLPSMPLDPPTVMANMPAVVPEQVRVAVLEPPAVSVTLALVQVGPDGADVAVRLIVPVNPFRLFTLIAVVVEDPAGKVIVAG